MKTLLVLAHPRRNSLSGAVAEAFAAAASAKGHAIDWADLVAEGFDPVLRAEDEPDWNDPKKLYSPAVRREMARIERNEATVMVFPVWWWSMPAILKGWIDRVWNFGWAYGGGATYPHRRVWMLAVAGADAPAYAKRDYDRAMSIGLDTGSWITATSPSIAWNCSMAPSKVARGRNRSCARRQRSAPPSDPRPPVRSMPCGIARRLV